MKKRWFCLLCAQIVLFVACVPTQAYPAAPPSLSLSAQSAVLMDAKQKTVLFEKNAHVRRGMASTTKIMTALVALEHADPQREISVPKEAVGTEGSSVYLVEGEVLTLSELLYALLLSSANDAAVAIAVGLGGSVEQFCTWMNRKAEQMGLLNTHFTNPHGLYDEQHYTTACELAQIAAAALEHPFLRTVVSTEKTYISHNGVPDVRLLVNHNKLLRTYEGAVGVKTGFTQKSGRTLVSAAERNGLTLIAVTLNAPDDWNDHRTLLDYGFSHYEMRTFFEAGEFSYPFPVVGGISESVTLTNTEPLTALLPKTGEEPSVRVLGNARFLFAPTDPEKPFGQVALSVNGITVTSPLRPAKTVLPQTNKRRRTQKGTSPFFGLHQDTVSLQ